MMTSVKPADAGSHATKTGAVADDPEANREARGSVQEAIGKLIGDDKARVQGKAEKHAAAAASAAAHRGKPAQP